MSRITTRLLCILTASLAFSQSPAATNSAGPAESFTALATAIEAFGPRIEGSVAEAGALDLLDAYFRDRGIPVRRQGFAGFEGAHSFSQNLIADVGGTTDATVIFTVAIGEPAGTTISDATSLAVAALLAGEVLALERRPRVIVAFLGAQHGSEAHYPMGSTLYIRRDLSGRRPPLFALSFRGGPVRLQIQTGAEEIVSPYWMADLLRRTFDRSGIFSDTVSERNTLYRLGISGRESQIGPFLEAGYPSIELTEGRAVFGDRDAWAVRLLDALTGLVSQAAGGLPAEWERHYLVLKAAGEQTVLDEQSYVLGFLATFLVPLGYGLIFQRRGRKYRHLILKEAWSVPILLGIVFIFLTVSTLMLRGFLGITRFPTLWRYAPVAFLLLKMVLPTFLFTLIFHRLHDLPVSKKGSFYSAASVLLLFAATVATAALNISLAYYFLWAFFFAFLFTLFRPLFFKLLAFAASVFWVIRLVLDALALDEFRLLELVILSPVWANLLLAFIILPFLLMLIRVNLLIRHPGGSRTNLTLRIFLWASGIASVTLLVFVFLYTPFSGADPLPVSAVEEFADGRRSLLLEAPAPPGAISVQLGGEAYPVSMTDRSYSLGLPPAPAPVSIEAFQSVFLGRRRNVVTLSSSDPVRDVDFRLESDEPMIVDDTDFPYTLSEDGRRLQVHIGRNPPMPLSVDVTVRSDGPPRLRVVATTDPGPDSIQARRSDIAIEAAGRVVWEGSR